MNCEIPVPLKQEHEARHEPLRQATQARGEVGRGGVPGGVPGRQVRAAAPGPTQAGTWLKMKLYEQEVVT